MAAYLLLICAWGVLMAGAATLFSVGRATKHALKQIQTPRLDNFDDYWKAKNNRIKWDKYAWRCMIITIVLLAGIIVFGGLVIFS